MRRAFLFRSIQRVIGDDVEVRDAAYLWTRHHLVVPFAVVVFVAVALLAPIAGIDDWPTRIVIGAAAVAVAVMATTDYRVLAETGDGLLLLEASKIRQVATGVARRLTESDELTPVGGTVLASEWQIAGLGYTVPRSSEQAVARMAAKRASGT